jgi:hypothetical protein
LSGADTKKTSFFQGTTLAVARAFIALPFPTGVEHASRIQRPSVRASNFDRAIDHLEALAFLLSWNASSQEWFERDNVRWINRRAGRKSASAAAQPVFCRNGVQKPHHRLGSGHQIASLFFYA